MTSSDSAAERPATPTLPLTLAIIAIAAPLLTSVFFPLLALAAVGGVVAIVFTGRAWIHGDRRAIRLVTFAVAAIGVVVDLAIVVSASVLLWGGPHYDRVELRASGAAFTATFQDDLDSYTQDWKGDDWFQRYSTARSWAEVSVTRAPGGVGAVSCSILWNDVVVVEQSSDDGYVTCRYDR